jgi:hypothetical protein
MAQKSVEDTGLCVNFVGLRVQIDPLRESSKPVGDTQLREPCGLSGAFGF